MSKYLEKLFKDNPELRDLIDQNDIENLTTRTSKLDFLKDLQENQTKNGFDDRKEELKEIVIAEELEPTPIIDVEMQEPIQPIQSFEDENTFEETDEKKKKEKGNKKKQKAKLSKPRLVLKIFLNAIFYIAVIALLVTTISFAQNDDPEKNIFGYRYYYIMSGSMQPTLPKGSIVFVKIVDPEEIKEGDDVTFHVDNNANGLVSSNDQTYFTHRVVEIIRSDVYGLQFRTRGIANVSNDVELASANTVIGVVELCIPYIGGIMNQIQDQIGTVIILLILVAVLIALLKYLIRLLKAASESDD